MVVSHAAALSQAIKFTVLFCSCSCIQLAHVYYCFTGQIGYALCPQVARGGMLGHNQPIILHLLDIPPAQQSLEGVKMELVDAAFPLLKGISYMIRMSSQTA